MEFSPTNNVVKLCLQGMDAEGKGSLHEAAKVFLQAWNEAANDFEKFLAAYYLARVQQHTTDKLHWLETALQFALAVDDDAVKAAFASLYKDIARCYDDLNDPANAKRNRDLAHLSAGTPSDKGPFYHGTKADLNEGDLLTAGRTSNYDPGITMNHIYFTALLNGAGLAAALAKGDGRERVYIVEPAGSFENDPNVTNKKFPGNPTRSYRTTAPLKITGEATGWVRLPPEALQKFRERLDNSKGEIIN